MTGLNHSALWQLAAEEAKEEATAMWPLHARKERRQTEYRLKIRYYKAYITPPNRYR